MPFQLYQFLLYLDPLLVEMKILDQDFFAVKYMKGPAFGYALGWTFLLFPAGSLTAFSLTGVRALRFLLDLDVSTSLMSFSIAPVAQNLRPLINLAFLSN